MVWGREENASLRHVALVLLGWSVCVATAETKASRSRASESLCVGVLKFNSIVASEYRSEVANGSGRPFRLVIRPQRARITAQIPPTSMYTLRGSANILAVHVGSANDNSLKIKARWCDLGANKKGSYFYGETKSSHLMYIYIAFP